jgi:hypothetical protein
LFDQVYLEFLSQGLFQFISSTIGAITPLALQTIIAAVSTNSTNKPIYINCNDRKEFVETLGSAWRTLRKNYIEGATENLCWEAYKDAKDMHPSISFVNISDSFLMRCNVGLAYIK